METKLLEDLVALSRARNLLQAAQARNVTHPAFGRRIKALEEWAGVALIERGHQTVTLNAAGRSLLTSAIDVLDILRQTRESLHRPEIERTRRIVIASGKTLAHSVLPDLLSALKRGMPAFSVKVQTTTLNYGIDMLVDGEVDFLLCHAHQPLYARIDNSDFRYRQVGSDKLVAVSAPAAPKTMHPKYQVPRNTADSSVPFLAYADSMSLGQVLRDRLRGLSITTKLETAYESDLADSIHAMAKQGFGLAWLPHTLIEKDLNDGTLVRADSSSNDIPMEIRLYQSVNMIRPLARDLWARVETYSAQSSRFGSPALAGVNNR